MNTTLRTDITGAAICDGFGRNPSGRFVPRVPHPGLRPSLMNRRPFGPWLAWGRPEGPRIQQRRATPWCGVDATVGGLKGRDSIPHVPFVEIQTRLPQQPSKLILKRRLAMMFFLTSDVCDDPIRFSRAHRERPISRLPAECAHTLCLHPLRGTGLRLLDDLGKGRRPGEAEENMDVIFHAAGLNRGTPHVRHHANQVRMQLLPDFWSEPRVAVLRAEDGMDEDGREGLRHGSDCIAALQAAGLLDGTCPGLRPSLLNGRPFGPDSAPPLIVPPKPRCIRL